MSSQDRAEILKTKSPDLVADVSMYLTSEGGRKSTAYPGYTCPCMVSNKPPWIGYDGAMLLGDTPINPGDKRRVGFFFLIGEEAAQVMRKAGKFYLWEGGVIGEALVVTDNP